MTPTDTPPPPDDPVERAVRTHLDRVASTVDAPRVLSRVRSATTAPTPPRRGYRGRLAAAGGLAVAAGLFLAFFLGEGPEPRTATAAELVREARDTHAGPTDRCYEVTAEWNPILMQRIGLDPLVRKTKLWTRGDAFVVTGTGPNGHPFAWGQGADHRVWVALGRRRGLVYAHGEPRDTLGKYVELMSLRTVTVLGELLEGYDLARTDAGKPGEPVRVSAVLRPSPRVPNPHFRRVELELDPGTRAIRSAVLTRQVGGETVGTLTFRLVEHREQPANFFELAGHVDPDAIVLDPMPVDRVPPTRREPGVGSGLPVPGLPPIQGDPGARFREEFLRRLKERGKS